MRFNRKIMKQVLSYDWDSFVEYANENNGKEYHADDTDKHHIHIDRGSNVLAVAHLDSVQAYNHLRFTDGKLHSSTIDNRLGAWLILFGLPSIGITCDVLLCDNEEMGMSTAEYFKPDKEYNWAFSFDRTGEDVVLYQHHTAENKATLETYGFTVGHGSYSDISYLDTGAVGFNFGCGMQNYHNANAYADIAQLRRNLYLFSQMHADLENVHLPSKAKPNSSIRYVSTGTRWWSGDYYYAAYPRFYDRYNANTKEFTKAYGNLRYTWVWQKAKRVVTQVEHIPSGNTITEGEDNFVTKMFEEDRAYELAEWRNRQRQHDTYYAEMAEMAERKPTPHQLRTCDYCGDVTADVMYNDYYSAHLCELCEKHYINDTYHMNGKAIA